MAEKLSVCLIVSFAGGGVTVHSRDQATLLDWSSIFETFIKRTERRGGSRNSIVGTWVFEIDGRRVVFSMIPADLSPEDITWFTEAFCAALA